MMLCLMIGGEFSNKANYYIGDLFLSIAALLGLWKAVAILRSDEPNRSWNKGWYPWSGH